MIAKYRCLLALAILVGALLTSPAAADNGREALTQLYKMLDAPECPPPHNIWKKDNKGREYCVKEVPKQKNLIARYSDKRIRVHPGYTLEIEQEKENSFLVKFYKPLPPSRAALKHSPTESDKKAVLDSYISETKTSSDFQLVDFGSGLPTKGQWRNGFDIADMNADGALDIVHGPARKRPGAPVIFLGNGKGAWKRWENLTFPRAPYDYGDVAAADFNGDGHQDIAMGIHLSGILVLVGDGKGAFSLSSKGIDFSENKTGNESPAFSSRTIEAADVNGDNRVDVIALGEGPRPAIRPRQSRKSAAKEKDPPKFNKGSHGVRVYFNQGKGSWRGVDIAKDPEAQRPFGNSLALADINSDGILDFTAASSVFRLKNIMFLSEKDNTWTAHSLEQLRPNSFIQAVAAADLNSDGRSEIVVSYSSIEMDTWRNGIDILSKDDSGAWKRRVLFVDSSRTTIGALAAGDVNGDGKSDIAALTKAGDVMLFIQGESETFTQQTHSSLKSAASGCAGFHIRLRDIDGDKRDEIIAGFAGESTTGVMIQSGKRCVSNGRLAVWKVKEV